MNGNSKLTNNQSDKIRFLYKNCKVSYSKLAKQFGVSHGTIGMIVRNKTYKKKYLLLESDILKASNKCFTKIYKTKKINYVKNIYSNNLEKAIISLNNNYLTNKKYRKKFKEVDIKLIEKAYYQLINFGYISKKGFK